MSSNNKSILKYFTNNALDIYIFLRDYYGISESYFNGNKITHKDIKILFPDLKRIDFDMTLKERDLLCRGEIIMVKDSFGNCAPYSKPIHMSYDADNDFIARVINTIIQYQEEENECCIVIPRNDILNVDFNTIEEKFFTVDFEKLEGVNTGTLNDLLNDITLLSKKFDFIFITVEKQNGVSLFIDGESKYNCTLNHVKLILIEEKILFNKPNPKFNSVDEDEYYPDVYSLEDLKLYELLNLLDKYKSKDKVLYWRIRHEITRRKSKNNKKKKKKKFELRKGDFDD